MILCCAASSGKVAWGPRGGGGGGDSDAFSRKKNVVAKCTYRGRGISSTCKTDSN